MVTVTNGWRKRTIERIEAIEGAVQWTYDSQKSRWLGSRWELTFGCGV